MCWLISVVKPIHLDKTNSNKLSYLSIHSLQYSQLNLLPETVSLAIRLKPVMDSAGILSGEIVTKHHFANNSGGIQHTRCKIGTDFCGRKSNFKLNLVMA